MNNQNGFPETMGLDFQKQWEKLLSSAEKKKMELPEEVKTLCGLPDVFLFSKFVADTCTLYPEILERFINSGDLGNKRKQGEYNERLKSVLSTDLKRDDESVLSKRLRQFRRFEMVRIAWRDIGGLADLSETMADLSALADACVNYALKHLYSWQCDRYGIPLGYDGKRQYLVVIGMGKLGAHELNFSSDIDLIFAYPQNGETEGVEKSISNGEFFAKLGRRLIQVIGSITSEGIVFRVDMNLRPFGENGPLVMSFDALEDYYQRQGREWERYAWIKARIIAGDEKAGNLLLNRLKPFVYRRYLDYGAFESFRDMKQKIALEVKRKGMEDNIKLGAGGIREIEFFGQVFQLIRGGVIPSLQKRGIRETLSALAQEKIIPSKIARKLNEAYIFLRMLENRLQEYSDSQTHRLPYEISKREKIAYSLGFKKLELFEEALKAIRETVHHYFNELLKSRDTSDENDPEKGLGKALIDVWQGNSEQSDAKKNLILAGFKNPDSVLSLLDNLKQNPATKALTIDGRKRLDKLMPLILKEVGSAEQPGIILSRIIDFIKTIERRTIYLALLLENPTALIHLVKLSNASPLIISFLTQHPVLLDELLDPRTLYSPPKKTELENEIKNRLDRVPSSNLEYQIEQLCIFKYSNILRTASADVAGTLPLMHTSDHLTLIAETILKETLKIAWAHLEKKHGKPTCIVNGKMIEKGFAVVAYGKLGGIELGYGSDLDLIFLHAGTSGRTQGGAVSIDNAQFFARLGQRVIHILTTYTSAGVLYETDLRLRPSGTSGVLVSHIDAYRDYQKNKAWTWEHQALIKARAVGGDLVMCRYFERIRREVLGRPRNKDNLKNEVVRMREKMRKNLSRPDPDLFDLKQDSGGMVDIEFLVQYLVLLNGNKKESLFKWTDNVRLIKTLFETEIFDELTAHALRHAYLIYRATAHKLTLQEKDVKVPQKKFDIIRKRVQNIWNMFLN